MKIGITGPGHPQLTKVYNIETGQTIEGVTRLEYRLWMGGEAEVTLTIHEPFVALVGDLEGVRVEYSETLLRNEIKLWLTQWREQVSNNAARALTDILHPKTNAQP